MVAPSPAPIATPERMTYAAVGGSTSTSPRSAPEQTSDRRAQSGGATARSPGNEATGRGQRCQVAADDRDVLGRDAEVVQVLGRLLCSEIGGVAGDGTKCRCTVRDAGRSGRRCRDVGTVDGRRCRLAPLRPLLSTARLHDHIADGETVMDVPAKLSARLRGCSTPDRPQDQPVDAHSVAMAGLRTSRYARGHRRRCHRCVEAAGGPRSTRERRSRSACRNSPSASPSSTCRTAGGSAVLALSLLNVVRRRWCGHNQARRRPSVRLRSRGSAAAQGRRR